MHALSKPKAHRMGWLHASLGNSGGRHSERAKSVLSGADHPRSRSLLIDGSVSRKDKDPLVVHPNTVSKYQSFANQGLMPGRDELLLIDVAF
jgi:hypothetical protein